MNGWIIGIGAAALGTVLNLLLKKFVTEERIARWGLAVRKFFKVIGTTVTGGLSKWTWSKPVWNSTIEPLIIVVLRTIILNALDGFIQGLESDKPSLKEVKSERSY